MGDRLAGSVVLVTGASAEIGQASVLALAGEGARLVVTARRQERLDELVARAWGMLEPEDVAGAVLLACTQSPGSRISEIQMRTMAEPLA